MEEYDKMNRQYDYEVEDFTHVSHDDPNKTISGYLIRYWAKGDLETTWTIFDFATEEQAHEWWNKYDVDAIEWWAEETPVSN